jgi:hypothetical protein
VEKRPVRADALVCWPSRLVHVPFATPASHHAENKRAIARAGGLGPLVALADSDNTAVQVEAVAAIANLSVDDENEKAIAQVHNALPVILRAAASERDEDLTAQCARALRNLSCCSENVELLKSLGAEQLLAKLAGSSTSEKTRAQAQRALSNIAAGHAGGDQHLLQAAAGGGP